MLELKLGARSEQANEYWPVRLFNRSVLKQRKYREITQLLGETKALHCLDIGSDNGVISYLLRGRGGTWKSADLDQKAIQSIRGLVKTDVFQIDARRTLFKDNEFDRIVIVDFLEHIHTDREFIDELYRIVKPGGELIINVPHLKNSLLRKLRQAIGQTDEKHGHVRPGYTIDGIASLLSGKFRILSYRTYSKFFSECVDIFISFGFELFKKEKETSTKGQIVTEMDMLLHKKAFWLYSLVYPIVWCFTILDSLLFWCSGYMLIVKTKVHKEEPYVNQLHTFSQRIVEMKK